MVFHDSDNILEKEKMDGLPVINLQDTQSQAFNTEATMPPSRSDLESSEGLGSGDTPLLKALALRV